MTTSANTPANIFTTAPGDAFDDIDLPSDDALRDLAARVVSCGEELGLTVGCAESCTGGLVSAALTAIPGSSAVVRGGVASYAIPVKHEVLGVSSDILDDPALGAVSSECAAQMSEGARRVLGCDVAVSVTGIAGPTGAEPGKPVGTVWFAVTSAAGTATVCHRLAGDRDGVRARATGVALQLLHDRLAANVS